MVARLLQCCRGCSKVFVPVSSFLVIVIALAGFHPQATHVHAQGLLGGGQIGLNQPGLPGGNQQNGEGGGNGAAGGGALADFDSLMTLIQNTIEPDVWEALGGVSTMAPYPAGIVVLPSGLVHESASDPKAAEQGGDQAREIAMLLDAAKGQHGGEVVGGEATNQPADWRQPASIRCVSLRRMMQAMAAKQSAGKTTAGPSSVDQSSSVMASSVMASSVMASSVMAGLSRVTMVMVTEDDLILAGPVGGFQQQDGWWVDRKTGLPPMTLTSLAVGISAARNATAFGCTIDPRVEGLQAAAALAKQISSGTVAIGLAAEQLAASLGRQDIRVFGTPAEHEVAWLLVEADRHMKQLALGEESMPEGARNYLQMIQSTAGSSPPTDLLLRLWFTGKPLDARSSRAESARLILLAGSPLRLSGENELAKLSGERGNRVLDDSTIAFVDHFNDNWSSIRSKYPLYGALESVYLATAVAELWKRHGASSDHDVLQRAVMHFAAENAVKLTPPSEVDSIAVLHRYRKGRKMHSLVLASGGVSVVPNEVLPMKLVDYPGLAEYAQLAQRPNSDRWWWNAK